MKKISKNKITNEKIEKTGTMLRRYSPSPSSENCTELNANKEEILEQLNQQGLYLGLKLKQNTLNSLLTLSNNSKLIHNRTKQTFNNLQEVDLYNKGNKKPCCIVHLIDPSLKNLSDLDYLIDKIARDNNLLQLADSYLGKVKAITTLLTWATVCESENIWRKKEHTVFFHYDVHDFNFMYVFFYLTDCDKMSGAHELIQGSHNKKKIRHLIGRTSHSEKQLKEDYNLNDYKIIEGNAGFGFAEDTSCYHRALIPTTKPRLALQIRYH